MEGVSSSGLFLNKSIPFTSYSKTSHNDTHYNHWSVLPIQKPRCIVRYFRSQASITPKNNDNLAISLIFLGPEAIVISSFCWIIHGSRSVERLVLVKRQWQ
jgi:hypothetical protein